MTVQKVLIYTEDADKLRKKSRKVKKVNAQTQQIITDLKETLLSEPGAGLAAPQIGVHKRVVVVRFGQSEGEMEPPRALINPVILEAGEDKTGFDGCLSLPKIVTWDTPRPTWLRFRAQDEDGKPFEMRVEGIDARLLHHEIDHLDGVMFMDRLTDTGQLFISVDDDEGMKHVPIDRAMFEHSSPDK